MGQRDDNALGLTAGSSAAARDEGRHLAEQLPNCVSVFVSTPDMFKQPLLAEETSLVEGTSSKRSQEIRAGRAAARAALMRLGCAPLPILRSEQRAPVWPVGFTGSITHCEDFVCAAVARAQDLISIGIDAESADPLETALVRLVCRPDELTSYNQFLPLRDTSWPKLAFSAKEAFYKCLYPLTGESLDFTNVSVAFSVDVCGTRGESWIRAIHGPRTISRPTIAGRWAIRGGRVYTSAVAIAP